MAKVAVELDQQLTSEVPDGYGTIAIRVVVVTPKQTKPDDDAKPVEIVSEFDEEDSDPDDDEGTGPLAAYLEKKSYGKWCAVFLINGQRHDAWDNQFISRDLEFKFLRDRTMVIVDLDGLSEAAMSEIMQGSRQGLYQGKVYAAIRNRIIQTLKTNPELKQLQVDAEQKALDMKAGDEAVKNKLNQLIEGHHATAPTDGPGESDLGTQPVSGGHFGDGLRDQSVVIMGGDGSQAELPVLITTPLMNAIRLRAGESKEVVIIAEPREAWGDLDEFKVDVVSEDEHLTGEVKRTKGQATVTVHFSATDYDSEDFPVMGELQAFARFKDKPEVRALKIPIVVSRKPTPPEPIELVDPPTFLRVRNRQPIRMVGGSTVHVRMQWNGKASLLKGSRPKWRFTARCTSLGTFPPIGFGYTSDGGLTFILCPPNGLLVGANLDFEVVANGPDGAQLIATFRGVVIDPPAKPSTPIPTPTLVPGAAPPTVGQRRPPYELKYIGKADWENPERPCFQGGGAWTEHDAGCFLEPTSTQPLLLLVVNEDMGLLKNFREGMLKRKPPLDPKTIADRTNRYISYVAFHLYQMYGEHKRLQAGAAPSSDAPVPAGEEEMRAEINRVGTTVMKVMELGVR
jgi:hypothetical protein